MNHLDGIKKWHEFAETAGIPQLAYYSLIDRAAMKLGLKIPPQYFWHWLPTAVFKFAFMFIVFVAVFSAMRIEKDFSRLLQEAAMFAGLFGLISPLQTWFKRSRMGLKDWDSFLKTPNESYLK